jgi:choline dehydrogenase
VATFDYVVVGAGSAGVPLAVHLSEDASVRVLLVEGGPDYPRPETVPADLLDALHNPSEVHGWGYVASPVPGRWTPYQRGRLVGGTSAVNACLAIRATPSDFDEWVRLGNLDWSWENVLPFFRALEDDQDYPGDSDGVHGAGGPVPVVRWRGDELVAVQGCFYRACRAAGFAHLPDHNHPDAVGVGPLPMNRDGLTRVSTARAYLDPARDRPNLTVWPNAIVDRVHVSGTRAVGVDLIRDGAQQAVHADRVVLCAGAVNTPGILCQSGIGPANSLRGLGIRTVVDLPGVGQRLADHPSVPLWLVPRSPDADLTAPTFQVAARYSDPDGTEVNDVTVFASSAIDLSGDPALVAELGTAVAFGIHPVLMRPHGTGRLTLTGRDPRHQPTIALDFLSEPEDLRRLMAGVRLAWELAHGPQMAPVVGRVAGLDAATLTSHDALASYVRANVDSFCHALGTARMGPDSDPGAVVDQRCRVRGVDNLWIADASVMPAVPSVPPNLTTIMIGERVARWLQDSHGSA